MRRFILAIALIWLTSLCYGKVQLPAIINNNMVLQQKSNVALWGHAVKSGKVVIITGWNNKKYTAITDTAGSWQLQVRTPQAGGPFKISFNDGELLELSGILIGEVWVCSGQSNMEMPVKGYNKQPILNASQIIDDANKHPAIRIFRVPKIVSAVPLNDCKGKWLETDSQTVKDFSAIAYQYATILQAKLKVPIGILATYWGGTAIQSWMSKKTLSRFAEVNIPERLDTITDPEKAPEQSPAILFNSMIAPIAGYGIKGFIWYQGESNRYNPSLYAKLMPVMVKEWRRLWNLGNLPFYYVQIAPYEYSGPNNYFSALLREVQFKLEHKIPHTGMIVSLDVGKQQFIHPPDKTTISERLSNYALAETYHRLGMTYLSPAFKRMKINKEQLYLKFTNTGGGLQFKDKDTGNFEIAGNDKIFYPAQAVIVKKDQVRVHSDQVKEPVAVRYAFKNWCVGNLYTKEGMPTSSFRTDNWDQLN
jgi:sialate O-acetylesterase